jgi:site-specific DNA-methyltransferase (adenine-specific)
MTHSIDLRLGRWQDVLADVETCDCVVTDPPYSARTHEGALSATGESGVDQYHYWTAADAVEFCEFWAPRVKSWIVILTDDVLGPVMRDALESLGRYPFCMLPILQHQPRQMMDGPAPFGCVAIVSRPREARFVGFSGGGWGSLPGWYEVPREKSPIRGAKPINLMRAIVRDYSRPGDLVVDPFCGSGTTALACAQEGRRCITSEEKPEHFEIAQRRLARGYTPGLF